MVPPFPAWTRSICLSNTAFCGDYYGKPFQKRQHFMERLCDRVGVKPFGFHSIRHLFASKLWRQNVSLGHIQQLLRHKSPRITEQYLQSLGLERVRRSLELTFNPAGDEDPEEPWSLYRPHQEIFFRLTKTKLCSNGLSAPNKHPDAAIQNRCNGRNDDYGLPKWFYIGWNIQ